MVHPTWEDWILRAVERSIHSMTSTLLIHVTYGWGVP